VGLPASIVKYGGSILWATMVFFLTSILAGTSASIAGVRLPRWRIALIAAVIAVSVELFRLVHAPWLDAFRLTLAGALLLGRIFSPWDMVAYGAGIILGMLLDRLAVPALTKATP
jgi:hydrogenase/urease accessory protein HupE